MRKIIRILALAALASPLFALALYNDVSLQSGAVISSNGVTINVSGTASVIETLTVDDGTFTAVMQDASQLSLTMPNRNVVAYSTSVAGSDIFSVTCDSSNSTIAVSHTSATSSTITFTPSSSLCGGSGDTGGGGGPISGGGGGGGGGGSYTPPATSNVPTTTITVSPGASGNLITVPKTIGTTYAFSRSLSLGMSGADVKEIQRVFATDPTIYPEANLSGYFGGLTQKAVQRFQERHGITGPGKQGYGVFGPATRAKFMSVYGASAGTPSPAVPAGASGSLTVTLKKGQTHAQVKFLQMILNKDPETQVATNGVGSAGMETNFFGGLTEKAVIKFQTKYGIDPIGLVGPMTRAKLNSL